jgi:SAM-dependent methyltransferase
VNATGVSDLEAFLASRTCRKFTEKAQLVKTEVREQSEPGRILLEHERIPFPSFPYEWPPEMLHRAGTLTIELARELLDENLGLKDATPYNVLFRGPEPVFIDLLSFERRDPADPIWLPYGQFTRTFLLPLLANRRLGLPLDQLLSTRRDGLEPEEVYRWATPLRRLCPPFLGLVSAPVWLARRQRPDDTAIYRKKTLANPEKARFILASFLERQRRALARLAPAPAKRSTWSDYMATLSYSRDEFQAKHQFVDEVLAESAPKTVLDIGANTGHFSVLAARRGASVVAIDYDPVVIGELWRTACAEKLDILPLVVNIARPTPAIGWRNQECPSFLDRARGSFDAVFMLALIHHLLVSERIPLPEIISLAAELTTGLVVVEFVAPEDVMFRRLTRGREHLHTGLTQAVFEEACRDRFDIVRSVQLESSTRRLYLLRKRSSVSGKSHQSSVTSCQ